MMMIPMMMMMLIIMLPVAVKSFSSFQPAPQLQYVRCFLFLTAAFSTTTATATATTTATTKIITERWKNRYWPVSKSRQRSKIKIKDACLQKSQLVKLFTMELTNINRLTNATLFKSQWRVNKGDQQWNSFRPIFQFKNKNKNWILIWWI